MQVAITEIWKFYSKTSRPSLEKLEEVEGVIRKSSHKYIVWIAVKMNLNFHLVPGQK